MNDLQVILKETVQRTEDEYVFVDPVCEFFGIRTKTQLERINRDPICQSDSRKNSCQSLFGDKRRRLSLGKRGFIRWIQIISPEIVSSNLRELFQNYQVAVFDYLYLGAQHKTQQLEDLKQFNTNIDKALNLRSKLRAYITEQNKFKKLCLDSSPSGWNEVRGNLQQRNSFPVEESQGMVNVSAYNSYSVNELKQLKTKILNKLSKSQRTLDYQHRKKQPELNPMPKGYRRASIERKIKDWTTELLLIDERIGELNQLANKSLEG